MSAHHVANHLLELARDVVKQAQAAGATGAECTMAEGEEFSANVRMREVENLKEAGSRGVGLRILIGKKTGASYTSDLSKEGVAHVRPELEQDIEHSVAHQLDPKALAGLTRRALGGGIVEIRDSGRRGISGDL